MALRRIVLGLSAAALAAAGGIWIGSMVATAQQPPAPPSHPPPQAYPPPPAPSPFPFPIPFPDAAAREMLLEGADKLIRALERMILTIPTYDPPVVTPEGDIIIRRRPAPLPPLPAPAPPGRLPAPGTERTTI